MTAAKDVKADPIGATPGELACLPGLLFDLATCLLPRRVALCRGLMAMLGHATADKVRTLLDDMEFHRRRLCGTRDSIQSQEDRYEHARALGEALAKLERALFSLVIVRLKRAHQLVPPMVDVGRVA